ncbi:MAG TPA: ATP-binding protein [Methylomirabilota bacterium]
MRSDFLHVAGDRLAGRIGGARILALPLLRALAMAALVVWLALAPDEYRRASGLLPTVVGFLIYSLAVEAALWWRPSATLRLDFYVLLVDQLFALTLIYLTGGARNAFYLALPLIAGLQAYYYGLRRGVAVALVSATVYAVIVWPTIETIDVANLSTRLIVLLGAPISAGLVASVQERERRRVATLTADAGERDHYIRNVMESLREGLIGLDHEGRITAWNPTMERWCGVAERDLKGRTLFDVNPNLKREILAEPLQRLLRGEIDGFKLDAVEHETLRGEHVAWNVSASLLRQGGLPAGAVLLIEDITERRGLERAAKQSEKLAALGTLAAGLAHELNNPIGIISTRAELMLLDAESKSLPDDLAEDLRVIHWHSQRVARITQGLLSFARSPAGQAGRVDLNRVVDETLLLVEKTIVKDGVRIQRALTPDLPMIWGDANALQQVVVNLLTNAHDAVRTGGDIFIETRAAAGPPGSVQLVVRDTGAGIPPEVLGKIFDPFFTTKAEGTGLGLSITYGIVRDHRGTVDVRSAPGEGTTFVLTFRGVRPGDLA